MARSTATPSPRASHHRDDRLGRRHLPHHPKRNGHEPRQLHRQRHERHPHHHPGLTSSTITWTPAALTYGTGLGAAQLTPPPPSPEPSSTPQPRCILPAGAQTLSATFTPTDTADYAPQTVTATLTVNKATLTLTAANASRPYNTPNPTFTGTLSGAVNGDTFTESFSTTATIASVAGTYPITPSATGTNLANYTVSATNGTLTITPASTSSTITWTPAALTYGTGLGAAQLNATSTIAGPSPTPQPSVRSCPQAPRPSPPPSPQPIPPTTPPRPSPPPSRSIRPPSTLTAANASRPYNTPNPTFTGTLVGAVNGDTFTEASRPPRRSPRSPAPTPSPQAQRARTSPTTPSAPRTAPSPSPRPQPAPPSPGPPLPSPTGQASALPS